MSKTITPAEYFTQLKKLKNKNTNELLKSERIYDREILNRGILLPIVTKEDLNIYYNLVTLGGNRI